MAVAVAVCRSAAMSSHFQLDSILAPSWPEKKIDTSVAVEEDRENIPPGQFDIWSSIQSQKPPVQAAAAAAATPPYVHPLMRRSSSLLSEKSLEICTENLGSETGSDGYSSSSLSDIEIDSLNSEKEEFISSSYYHERVPAKGGLRNTNELVSVNYHCSASRRSPPRSFPPPLPSMSRRDGPCLQMRPHRRDGRLVVEAVHVRSHNYLHAQRNGGRLLLCFIDAAPNAVEETNEQEVIVAEDEEEQVMEEEEEEIEDEEEEEEEEEEVEVVDRGTVVEVKVSTQPQQLSGAMKVHRSSLVINKFLGGTPQMSPETPTQCHHQESPTLRRSPSITTTTAATAAVVAASTLLTATSSSDGWNNSNSNNNNNNGEISGTDNSKMLFTSKRRNKEELLHHMRRCSQLRRPLFIWEPCYITTSS